VQLDIVIVELMLLLLMVVMCGNKHLIGIVLLTRQFFVRSGASDRMALLLLLNEGKVGKFVD
jgi:hypothetical protein